MRGFLVFAFVVGLIALVFGLIERVGLQSELSRQPAIVVMPQVINAWLIAGFGFLASTIAAAGLALADALDRLAAQPAPPARSLPPPDTAATPPPTPMPTTTDPQPPKRLCPSCDKLAPYTNGVCQNCGWDYLAKRGPHAGRGPAQPAEAMKTCQRCARDVELWRLNCPHCGNQFGSVRPPGPLMKDRG